MLFAQIADCRWFWAWELLGRPILEPTEGMSRPLDRLARPYEYEALLSLGTLWIDSQRISRRCWFILFFPVSLKDKKLIYFYLNNNAITRDHKNNCCYMGVALLPGAPAFARCTTWPQARNLRTQSISVFLFVMSTFMHIRCSTK